MHSTYLITTLLTFLTFAIALPAPLGSQIAAPARLDDLLVCVNTGSGICEIDSEVNPKSSPSSVEARQIPSQHRGVNITALTSRDFETSLLPRQLQCTTVGPGKCQLVSYSWPDQVQTLLMIVDPNCNKIGQDLDVPIGMGGTYTFYSQLPQPVIVDMVIGFLGRVPELNYEGIEYGGNASGARCSRIFNDGLGCLTPFDC